MRIYVELSVEMRNGDGASMEAGRVIYGVLRGMIIVHCNALNNLRRGREGGREEIPRHECNASVTV